MQYEYSRIADGGPIYYSNLRSWRVALLSNGVAETEAEGSHCNVADETS